MQGEERWQQSRSSRGGRDEFTMIGVKIEHVGPKSLESKVLTLQLWVLRSIQPGKGIFVAECCCGCPAYPENYGAPLRLAGRTVE